MANPTLLIRIKHRVPVAAIARLAFLPLAYQSADYTFDSLDLVMATQFQLYAAVLVWCVSSLLKFLDGLNVGYFSSAINKPKKGQDVTKSSNRSVSNAYGNPSQTGHSRRAISNGSGEERLITHDGYAGGVIEAVPMDDMKRSTEIIAPQHIRRDFTVSVAYE